MNKIILASASPRRKELLTQIGLSFEIITSDAEEITKSTLPQEMVEELSLLKAKDVWKKLPEKERAEKYEKENFGFGAYFCDGSYLNANSNTWCSKRCNC